ncbi:rhodanese-like domain-containing protein [Halorarius halobius]|uniref:rhodanese-like domain-containing protein n=1 Tax=Halorarius halobius TaxID=2962671 RepID=UPI0020CF211F|nr:rhodanese-like domain-containing protein [Halorarius halobius]
MDGELSASELAALLESDADVRVVDIRSPAAFDRGHIPGSVNIPFEELPDRVAELDGAERVVTVCPHGQASVQAARLVGSYQGTQDAVVESLAPGIEGWAAEYGLERADARADGDGSDEGPEAPF